MSDPLNGFICAKCGDSMVDPMGLIHACQPTVEINFFDYNCPECFETVSRMDDHICKVKPPKQYSLGFLFDEELQNVVMIKKNRPKWQSGLLNGIGGKLEDYETPHDCMVREFKEETGLTINHWLKFGSLSFDAAEITLFCASSKNAHLAKTTTDEVVWVIPIWQPSVNKSACIENIPSLIELAIQRLKL